MPPRPQGWDQQDQDSSSESSSAHFGPVGRLFLRSSSFEDPEESSPKRKRVTRTDSRPATVPTVPSEPSQSVSSEKPGRTVTWDRRPAASRAESVQETWSTSRWMADDTHVAEAEPVAEDKNEVAFTGNLTVLKDVPVVAGIPMAHSRYLLPQSAIYMLIAVIAAGGMCLSVFVHL
ncbi:MAG: uncharacterized protein KVP18_004526 [Porospora cf. gigantea A]|uniref:uncharacterized protein n=1 Tax=Porospora cf. gigantea A TaxID=2853593 RepID=UPI00355A5E5A|nr:MAG: hypothetical protein KVP18_004526 [Porospora cf. gigantea A]